ncbi:MAG: hypothetical protein IKS31_01160 [Clostridia bacterium]|nr:hypothetical protein [Clostridia bacterium]
MNKKRILALAAVLVVALAVVLILVLGNKGGGNGTDTAVAEEIVNGDFENVAEGQWVGWTRKDAAFNFRGVTDLEKISGAPMEKSGTYYFAGTQGGNPAMRGTLTSDPFRLGGNGFITFKMGAGKNTEKVYVEFFEQGNDKAIAKVTNDDCDGVYITDHLIDKVVDLSAYKGKTIYIVATDNDDGNDLSWLNLDAFRICATDAEVKAARAEHDRQIADYGEKPFVEDETSNRIQNGSFETGDLTGWLLLEGNALTRAAIVPTSQYYWSDRMVYGDGEYYLDGSNNGAIQESLTGAIRSSKFTLGGDGFITFMMGAGNGGSYVALCDAATDEELIRQENTYFSDPALALTLLRFYVDASEYTGRVVYLKVVDANDGSNGGFAFLNVDDFRVSLTRDEVAALEVEQIEKIQAETYTSATYDDLTSLRNFYNNYPYPVPLQSLAMTAYAANQVVDCGTVDLTAFTADARAAFGEETLDCAITKVAFDGKEFTEGFDAFDMSAPGTYQVSYGAAYNGKTVEAAFTVIAMDNHRSVPNGGFETGNLAGWTVLTDGWSVVEGQPAGVISAVNYWGEQLPYNQAGDWHLDGWNNGIPEPETWQIRSGNFTLEGSGFISVRMGGHAAAVHVFKADGTEVGCYQQTRFNDANFPSVGAGGSWADMGTYVMDLSAYLGEELYIVLADEAVEGWAHAFFDEVVTFYEEAPDVAAMADTVIDGGPGAEISIPWQLAVNLK